MGKIELLAPAGNLEKLQMAIIYGADAVYIGGENFSLRAYADNFTIDDMYEGINFVHEYGKKIYLTINTIPNNSDIESMYNFLVKIKDMKFDAFIISDPGVIKLVRDVIPVMNIHLSTQANNTNYMSAMFWREYGVKRIVLARELSLSDAQDICQKVPEMEFELFVHGAMCISFSGRCLLSSYMTGRNSNNGLCAHPCRWKYYLMEEKRPGEYLPIVEDSKGTYIFNSKDLCMIEHIKELVDTGITSIKIEGRVKSSFYVATVVSAYRRAIDNYYNSAKDNYEVDKQLIEEVQKVSHREFTTGFYFEKPSDKMQVYKTSSYIREYDFVGVVMDFNHDTMIAFVEQRNRFYKGDIVEILNPDGSVFVQKLWEIKDEDGQSIDVAPHPQMKVYMRMESDVEKYAIIRKKK